MKQFNFFLTCILAFLIVGVPFVLATPTIYVANITGTNWYIGTAIPDVSTGYTGDFYLKNDTYDIYQKNGAWGIVGNIKGSTGAMNLTPNMTANMTASNLDTSWNLSYPLLSGARMLTGIWNAGGYNVSNLSDPISAHDAATRNWTLSQINSSPSGPAINNSYVYLPGRAGGQILNGGINNNENLTLNATSNGNGNIILNALGGDVGIGTSPNTVLHVYGKQDDWITRIVNTENTTTSVAGKGLVIQAGNASVATQEIMELRDYLTNPEVTFLSNGNVGLGSTTPANKLVVIGGNVSIGENIISGVTGTGGSSFADTVLNIKSNTGRTALAVRSSSAIATLVLSSGASTQDVHLNADTSGKLQIYQYNPGMNTITLNKGNVGLGGVAAPTAQLHMTGMFRDTNCSGTPTFDAGGNMTCASDLKLKEDVQHVTSGLSIATAMPSAESWKWSASSGYDTQATETGLIAQEVQAVYPQAIIARDDIAYSPVKLADGTYDIVGTKTGTQTLSIDQGALIALLFNSLKEEDAKVTLQQLQIDNLTARLNKGKL